MDYRIQKNKKFTDNRGDLIVFLKESDLGDAYKKFGEIYIVTFKKRGVIRGNHYHKHWHEWFGIIEGKVQVILEDIKTKKRKHFIIDAKQDRFVRLEIGPYIAHAFKSLTTYALLINYGDSEWYEEDSIHYQLLP